MTTRTSIVGLVITVLLGTMPAWAKRPPKAKGKKMRGEIPGLKIALDGTPLASADEPAVQKAVETYNRQWGHGRPELPDALNPRCLSAAEATALLTGLSRLPEATRKALSGETLDLASDALKLSPVDGFGVHGYGGSFNLVKAADGWTPSPDVDRADVEAELGRAMAFLGDQDRLVASQQKQADALPQSDPKWPPAFRAVATAKQSQALAQSVALQLVRLGLKVVGDKPLDIGGSKWDKAKLAAEEARLKEALKSAPATGGMPGSSPGGGGMPGAPGGSMPPPPGGAPGGGMPPPPGGAPGGGMPPPPG